MLGKRSLKLTIILTRSEMDEDYCMATKHRVAERTGCRQGFSRRHSRGLDVGQQAETRDVTGFQV